MMYVSIIEIRTVLVKLPCINLWCTYAQTRKYQQTRMSTNSLTRAHKHTQIST